MSSVEGEYVEFGHAVYLEGPVEAWLCDVEKTMRWTLKEVKFFFSFYNTIQYKLYCLLKHKYMS